MHSPSAKQLEDEEIKEKLRSAMKRKIKQPEPLYRTQAA